MHRFKDLSIRKKLIIIIMAVCMGTLFLSFGGFLAYDLITLRQKTVRSASVMANIIGQNCTAALVFSDETDARQVLSSLKSCSSIVSAWIFSRDGRPFAGYIRDPSTQGLASPPLRKPGHYFEEETFMVYAPIFMENAVIGTVSIKSDLSPLYTAIGDRMTFVAALIILSVVCAFLISSKSERLITGPIIALAELTKSVTRHKDYSIRGKRAANDEIGALVENFNHMLTEIERQHTEIVSEREKAEASQQEAFRLANETKGINFQLKREVQIRRAAEDALRMQHRALERLVEQRTHKLAETNARLIREIDERKAAEENMKDSLEEKKLLLSEIHHRVKNNLQVISNLLAMTQRRTVNEEARMIITEARSRIHTMAMIHSQLYESENFNRIDMKQYVNTLLAFISQMYFERRERIIPIIDGDGVHLSITQAIPCALALTELISNVFKHAYEQDEEGWLNILITHTRNEWVSMRVKDYGKGFPGDIDVQHAGTLGLKLARNLIMKQLDGKFEIFQQEGTEIRLSFPIDHDDLNVH
ncbi:MAG: sensor histidine kinase [Desulfobacteraceae bacterium]